MFTVEQYNLLVSAIAQGALVVKYADKTVEYRSLSEMLQIKKMMEDELFPNPQAVPGQLSTRRVVAFSKGLE